ncbi:MAG: hypothetical protein HQ568_10235 [Calditrichaeota bacterium]|nr:hypothetical protein [Calditrichota bacterium]
MRRIYVNGIHLLPIVITALILLFSGCANQTEFAKRALLSEDPMDDKLIELDNISDEVLLAKIAMEAQHWAVQYAAVNKLTNQDLLETIALGCKHWGVRAYAIRKLTNQDLLTRIALEDLSFEGQNDYNIFRVKKAAIGELSAQTILSKIALEDKDSELRVTAVERLTDQIVLAKVAVQDKESNVRKAAIGKLTDQFVLAKVAVEDKDSSIRKAASEKLTDQSLLVKVVENDKILNVRVAAIGRITNQAVLRKWAEHSTKNEIRQAAVAQLTDQALLAQIAMKDKDSDVRFAAIGQMTDQSILCQWAEQKKQAAIRQAVVLRITDDKFLIQRLLVEPSYAVRSNIIETLHSEQSLMEVALSTYYENDRNKAFRELTGEQRSLAIKGRQVLEIRVKVLASETDNEKLLTITLSGEFDVLRFAAAKRLSDPKTLEQAALQADDREVLKILLTKINDTDALSLIAKNASDRAMRLAATKKTGTKTWGAIFSKATAKGATAKTFGDAIAAVSLFTDKQSDARTGVQRACLELIRRGDESRIPEMAELLEGYGDRTLCEDYLNCGQPDLYSAGADWARSRGYDIGTGFGSSRAKWGGGR